MGLIKVGVEHNQSNELPTTYAKGSGPIDSIWVSQNVEIDEVVYMQVDLGIEDHRPVMTDILATYVLGDVCLLVHMWACR